MKKNIGKIIALAILCAVIIGACGDHASAQAEEVQEDSIFDTSIIENNWCGEAEDGTIRMVGAEVVSDKDGLYTLEDETGNLWEVADVNIVPDDFLLLWIADCGTPDDVTDDIILKCWSEVH